MNESELRGRVVGCVLGLALGDALGAPFEFRRAKDVPNPIPALELAWRGGPAGSTSDDTDMAINLVQSLVARGGFDPDDLVRRQVAWLEAGPPDVGTITGRVLRQVARQLRAQPDLDAGVLAQLAAEQSWSLRGPEVSAGNGSVMYCPPLGASLARTPDVLEQLAPELSALTHHDQRCRTAVLAVTLATAWLIRGEPREEAVARAVRAVTSREGGEELEFLVEAAGTTRPVDGPDQGFCLFAAAIGLQAAAGDRPFEHELRRVVALGGDTDTNGAVAGALVGAAVGVAGLPVSWLERLGNRAPLEAEAVALAALATRR